MAANTASKQGLVKLYKHGDATAASAALRTSLSSESIELVKVTHELCFNVALAAGSSLSQADEERLLWLLSETFEPHLTAKTSFVGAAAAGQTMLEVGPRLTFATAWSTNAVAICAACGLGQVERIEPSRRYLLETKPALDPAAVRRHAATLFDRMTECIYAEPLSNFDTDATAKPVTIVPVMSEGRAALERVSNEMGLGFDEADLDYYTDLFVTKLKRDPTDVECFDMGQSNSEHSRHWFFGGRMVLDGVEMPRSLFKIVKETLKGPLVADNSVIAFHDNSSSIKGGAVRALRPSSAVGASAFSLVEDTYHHILTAETHNFPCGVAPFPGAETGTGGRLRDVQATGRGAFPVAGISAYCMGNLHLEGYPLPWEEEAAYPSNLAHPRSIQIQASNGASDYGNKFGEPVICGFNRTFGMRLPNGERREWLKPIMFSAGLGQMRAADAAKGLAQPGLWVCKVGGPAYRIGVGGGAASSKAEGEGTDDGQAALDFNAVQRGDAEYENKMNRVIRSCIELGDNNPIVSIHDQGAGGNGNVLKEICEPLGAELQVREIACGDATLSVLELWGAEYQENCALLCKPEDKELFSAICAREHCSVSWVGQVASDGRLVLKDSRDGSTPVDLPLSLVLGEMPRKTYHSDKAPTVLKPLVFPADVTVSAALDRVMRLPSVGSKRFLTNKVDRSVTGLIAQQQCVGPLHTPLADVGVIAQTHQGLTGGATAIGEQPIKGLLSPAAMARLTVTEALTNLVWAAVGSLGEIKCSANWMWAAKLPGEGSAMYEACEAMADVMAPLGVSVDGGKDSLSMAARAADETVKAPGALVVTMYGHVSDITLTVTPDLKGEGSTLLFVPLARDRRRLGGSALAQVYTQIGDTCPDLDEPALLGRAFAAVQSLLCSRSVLSGHDVSDGGPLVALLEMAFAGNRGLEVELPAATAADGGGSAAGLLAAAFAEEPGLMFEVAADQAAAVTAQFAAADVPCITLGRTTAARHVRVTVAGETAPVVDAPLATLRDVWEATSFELEKLQTNPACVAQEQASLSTREAPAWNLSFVPAATPLTLLKAPSDSKPRVAVLRQEGSNGDREMTAALFEAGLQPWDVCMEDLLSGGVTLDSFRGAVFVGGFSYADVLDSAKGWAAVLKHNEKLWSQFQAFRERSNTFSLGVCNGCQLMALLGWVPSGGAGATAELSGAQQPRFVHNSSGRFESRFSSIKVLPSPAVLLKGMEGSTLGVWVAHGEGRAHFPDDAVFQRVQQANLAPLRYVDDKAEVTEAYPFNPNGSPQGIAALCSDDGRHLAMMPHPERAFLKWQFPWMPPAWDELQASPWLKLFQNAFEFASREA